jgi:hypothetical protein
MIADAPLYPRRWLLKIYVDGSLHGIHHRDEIKDFKQVIEAGPDWTSPGYRIEISYNRAAEAR